VEGNRQHAVHDGQEDGQVRVTRTYHKTGREVEEYFLTKIIIYYNRMETDFYFALLVQGYKLSTE
jgi:hypothetical protein